MRKECTPQEPFLQDLVNLIEKGAEVNLGSAQDFRGLFVSEDSSSNPRPPRNIIQFLRQRFTRSLSKCLMVRILLAMSFIYSLFQTAAHRCRRCHWPKSAF